MEKILVEKKLWRIVEENDGRLLVHSRNQWGDWSFVNAFWFKPDGNKLVVFDPMRKRNKTKKLKKLRIPKYMMEELKALGYNQIEKDGDIINL